MSQGQAARRPGVDAKAAQALEQAASRRPKHATARQAGPKKGGKNGIRPRPAAGPTQPVRPRLKQYAGKTWGELPGELQTQIVLKAKVKYGEDYARMIKLYFEQVADTRNRK